MSLTLITFLELKAIRNRKIKIYSVHTQIQPTSDSKHATSSRSEHNSNLCKVIWIKHFHEMALRLSAFDSQLVKAGLFGITVIVVNNSLLPLYWNTRSTAAAGGVWAIWQLHLTAYAYFSSRCKKYRAPQESAHDPPYNRLKVSSTFSSWILWKRRYFILVK